MTSSAVVLLYTVLCLNIGNIFAMMQCNDCSFITDCEVAHRLVMKNDNESQINLRKVFCGFVNNQPKVCCAALSDGDSNNNDKLANLPNLALLPQNLMQCNDCSFLTDCEVAYQLHKKNDNESQMKLRKVFCGFVNNQLKVCCAALSDGDSNNNDNLDNHPNLSLLPQECGFINLDKVFGGNSAKMYQFPWMALISHRTRNNLHFGCGGTLINKRYVLTAAHCIKNLTIAGVRIGEYDYSTETDCEGEPPEVVCESSVQDIQVEEATIHPDYSGKPGPVVHDIGLLRLDRDVEFTPNRDIGNKKPICLPVTSKLRSHSVYGAYADLAGWGLTETHTPSSVLMTVTVPVLTAENCSSQYYKGKNPSGEDLTAKKLCAGEAGKDSCSGDSGGPLMMFGIHNDNRYIQYGVVSTGPRNCGSGVGFYTDVSKYMKFILDTIRP